MAKRRNPGKASTPQAGETVKMTLSLPADLAMRFGVHAEMSRMSKSELFAKLVEQGCRRYRVHDHDRAVEPAEDVA